MTKLSPNMRIPSAHRGQTQLTLHEVADILNLTRERVRQIEAKALTKLRKHLQERGIKPSDLLES